MPTAVYIFMVPSSCARCGDATVDDIFRIAWVHLTWYLQDSRQCLNLVESVYRTYQVGIRQIKVRMYTYIHNTTVQITG